MDNTLPDPVRQYVARQLATWTFSRQPREGKTGTAATWLSLSACAVPDASGGYSMGLAYHGHGPRIKGGDPWVITSGMGKVVAKYKRQCDAATAGGAKSNAGLPVVAVDSVMEIEPSF